MSIFNYLNEWAKDELNKMANELDSTLNNCPRCGDKMTYSQEHQLGMCEDCYYDEKYK